jgi:hypothetical protein
MTSKISCLVKKSTKGYLDIFRSFLSIFNIFKFKMNDSEFLSLIIVASLIIGTLVNLFVFIGDRSYPNTALNWAAGVSSVWMPLVMFPIYVSFYNNLCNSSRGVESFIKEFLETYYEILSFIFMGIFGLIRGLIPDSKQSFLAYSLIFGVIGTLAMLIFIPTPNLIPKHETTIQIFFLFEFLWLPIVSIPFYGAFYECYCGEANGY